MGVQATVMAASRPGKAMQPAWRTQGWHRRHRLWLLHHDQLGICRVAVTLETPAKRTDFTRAWAVTGLRVFDNRPLAVLGKYAALDLAGPWRVEVRADLVAKGRHEVWLDTADPIDLMGLPVRR